MKTGKRNYMQNLYDNEKKYADIVYLRQPRDGKYHDFTWKETMHQARKVSSFLKDKGLKKGDCVAILSKNCAEWFIADFAIMMSGCISVPLYATQHKNDIRYILDHAEAKFIFIGKLDEIEKQELGIPASIVRVDFPYPNPTRIDYKWNEIQSGYEPIIENYFPKDDDIATILYTSGTTGKPKGAVHTFGGFNKVFDAFDKEIAAGFWNFPEHTFLLSYLPLAHAAERMIVAGLSISIKSTVSFVESIDTFADNLRESAPTLFFAVPRIWDIFRERILETLPEDKLDRLLKIPLISVYIKRKVQKSLGLHCSVVNFSGAAPLSTSTIGFFNKLGVCISEAYGQTENLAIATMIKRGEFKPGSVGKAKIGVDIKIGENSELLVKSPGNMSGYYKDSELTRQVFTEDNYFHTGDMGEVDEEGFVFIIGRIKDQFKTAKGEYVCPVAIEQIFANNINIEQLCLTGSHLTQPVMLVSLSESGRKKPHDKVALELSVHLNEINQSLTSHEKISHVVVTPEQWTVENELLTPTLKLKRREVELRYHDFVQEGVKSKHKVVWHTVHSEASTNVDQDLLRSDEEIMETEV